MGAVMDEHAQILQCIGELERGETRYRDGTAPTEEQRQSLLARMRDLEEENRAAYDWLDSLLDDGAAAGVEFVRGGAASLARFTGYVLKDHRNDGYPGDVDGDSLQGYAVRCGLIEERSVDAPCSEGCSCADVGVFPTVCYFNTDLGKTAIAAAHAEVQGGANASS
jgi:hypothetical protein